MRIKYGNSNIIKVIAQELLRGGTKLVVIVVIMIIKGNTFSIK